MITERTDVAAEVGTIRPVADLLQGADLTAAGTGYCEGCEVEVPFNNAIDDYVAAALAEAVLAGFVVVYEVRDRRRRAVLYGDWEVNPAAVQAGPPRG
jgi:hypothetical protein